MVLKKYLPLIFLFGGLTVAHAQQGVHGPRIVNVANTIVNEYTPITANVAAGSTTIPVANSALNTNGRFPSALQPGDLIMIYQVQGVFIRHAGIVGGSDSTWGRIDNAYEYYNCGRYELRQVNAVPNATSIVVDCGTQYDYSTGAINHRPMVIRVPRYTTLTINVGGVLTCDDWNGSVGGVLAVEVQGSTVINAGGAIDATGRGFRGGSLAGDNATAFGVNNTYSMNNSFGAEKGEGIAGYQADYDFFGGRYCRGAAMNGGGGGDGHNGGGGGGSNAPNSTNAAAAMAWSGLGVPDQSQAAWTTAWSIEPPAGTMNLRTNANSAGGGRGGYSFSGSNQNATTVPPGNAAWGGDSRNHEAAGLGGRPLDYSTGRLFMGGGGGAGDQNQSGGGVGGDGGGLIYLMCYGTVSGSGTITSNGNTGANGQGGTGVITGIDAAGGGGGGGTIVVNAVGGVANTLTLNANGGNGGNQVINLTFSTNEGEGPGGGGGGGYIAVSSGTPARNANGGNNGTTNSAGVTEFTPNGATRGCPGTNNATISNFDYSIANQTICQGSTATFTVTTTGTVPPGTVFNWYTAAVGGAPFFTGNSYTTPVLPAGTYTYYVGSCGGWWREPVTLTVNAIPATPVLGSNSPLCAGATLNLTSSSLALTYAWTGPNSFSSGVQNPSIAGVTTAASGTYSLTISNGTCSSPQVTINVTVNPTPAAPTVGSNSPLCAGQTLNLTANTIAGATYTWTGPNSFSSSLEDPSIPLATTAASGTYSLTVTVGGCTSPQSTVNVTVSNTPAAPVISSNTPVCSGNALNLFANTVAGGTYNWTGPNSFSSAVEDPTIAAATTAASGTYSLTISVGGCTSPQSTTAVVVNPTPAAPTVGSNSPICAGQTLNLTANTIAGATYTWTGPNSFSSSLEDPSIALATTAASGTYSLTVTVGGCTSAQSTVNVTVSNTPSAPVISSNTPVCSGNALNLFANTVAGGTYNWTGPNSFSSAVEDPTIAAATTAASGTYSLTISVGGCTSPQSTTAVVVNATPAAPTVGSNSPLCAGQTLNLTANTVAGGTYNWTGPNSFSSSLEDPSIAAATTAATGTYSLTITANGCTSPQSTVAVIVANTPGAPVVSSNTPVCTGNTLTLFANTVAGGTYTWTGPNSFSSSLEDPTITNITAAAAGTYSLTVSVGSCSSPQSTTTVVVNPTPAAPTVSSNSPLCSGQTLNLTSNTVAGATYSWTGPNSFTSALEDPSITNATTAATGTYSLTITVGGCTSAQSTVAVVVDSTPSTPVVSSNSPVCSGNALNLFANTFAGGVYNWTGPNSFTSSAEDPVITGVTVAATGTYSLTITNNGCVSPQSTIAVVVNQTPAAPGAGSNTPICSGQTLNLTTSTVAGATYAWTGPNSFTSALEDPSITGATTAETGMYYVTVTVSGCISPVDSVAVVVNPIPVPTISAVPATTCAGDTVQLTAGGGTAYNWNGGSLNNASGPSQTDIPLTSTTYSVVISDANGCEDSTTIAVTVNPLPLADAGTDQEICAGSTASLNGTGGGTYTWNGGALVNANGAAQSDVPASTTDYELQVTDGNGCTDLDTVNVIVNALPVVSAGADVQICINSQTVLNATGASSYVWTPAADLDNDSIASPTASPTVNTTYVVVGTDTNGCVNSDTVEVTIGNNLTVFASNDITICPGDTAVLTVTGGNQWSWTPAATLDAPTASTTNAFPSTTTTYTVNVQDANGCLGADSVTVYINPAVSLSATGTTTICVGQSAVINATPSGGTGSFTYTWDNSLSGPGPHTVSPTTTTTYNVFVTDSAGCNSTTQSIVVTVNPPLTLAAVSPAQACTGGTVTVTASGSGGDNNLQYTWLPGPLSGASQTFTVNSTDTYTVILTDGCGSPADSTTVTVTALPLPVVSLSSDVTTGCEPVCVNFTGTSSANCTGSLWQFGDNTTSIQPSPTHCYALAGTYDVTYTCTDANGCVGSATTTSMITVNARPVADFTMLPSGVIQVDAGNPQDVCMTDFTAGATAWAWSVIGPGGTQVSSAQNPCFTITDTGSYTVQLVVTNANGCSDTSTVAFAAEGACGDVYVPTAFSPNGDGQNDVLFVYGSCFDFMQFEVYSRWGEQVFITANPATGWDGTWRGKACEPGVFTYVLRGQRTDGTAIEMQGHINLIR
jgi:gliding motility-associated-like protein